MVSNGGDGPSGNRLPATVNKMQKTTVRTSRRPLPAYLNRNASNREPSTPPTSLQGPITLSPGPRLVAQPPFTLGLSEVGGGSSAAGSSNAVGVSPAPGSLNASGGSPAPESSNASRSSPVDANSHTIGGSPIDANSHTIRDSPVAADSPTIGNSVSSNNTTAPRRQAPRRRATPAAPRDEHGLFVVVLSPDYKIIDNHLATVVSNIFEEYPQAAAYTFKYITDDVINQYWEEFQKKCVWNRSVYSNKVMKKAFVQKLKLQYKGILNGVRKIGTQPIWCPDDVWLAWKRKWNSPEFKRRCAIAKKARGGKDGVPKGTHVGGSCSAARTAEKLEKQLNMPITPHQLFLWLHTRENDGMTFVNDRSKKIQAEFEDLIQSHSTPGTVAQALDEVQAFYRAAGGVTKERSIFGLGTAAARFYTDHLPTNATRASSSSFGEASTSNSNAENHTIKQMQEQLNRFNVDRARFIEYLDRVEANQMQQPHSDDGIHLSVDANGIRDHRERLIDLEAHMGPLLRQIQHAITQLQDDVQRIDRAMGSGSSMP